MSGPNGKITVIILIFPGFNTLDVNGPLEVLCNWALRDPQTRTKCRFDIKIAAESLDAVTAYEFIRMVPDITFATALTSIQEDKVDVLITPGSAPSSVINDLNNAYTKSDGSINPKIFEVITAFYNLKSRKERWQISICVGGLLNARAGVFNGRKATTHWGNVPDIPALAARAGGTATGEMRRWVDGGKTNGGVRILSSGGISCGIDAMLYFISQYPGFGLESAAAVADCMDYTWNGSPNVESHTKQGIWKIAAAPTVVRATSTTNTEEV